MPPFPVEIFARVFPFVSDDPTTWYNLAQTNGQLHGISKALGGPFKWPDTLVSWEDDDDDPSEHYVHQVKFSQDGRYMAIMLRVYENPQAVQYHRVVRVLDMREKTNNNICQPIQDLPMGRSTPFTAYCGNYFVACEPRRVRVFELDAQLNCYHQIQELPSVDRIVGIQCYHDEQQDPKIALQTENATHGGQAQNDNVNGATCTLTVWGLLNGQFQREIPYHGSANFCISNDDRVFACIDREQDGRPVTVIYFGGNDDRISNNTRQHDDYHGQARTYTMDLPGNPRRHWIDTCKFSPDGQRLAVLTELYIFQLDTSVEPPEWIHGAGIAPDGCTFSGQLQYSPDSQRIMAHARTPWDNVYRNDNHQEHLNTIQVWDAPLMQLQATKGFHDLVGSVGLSSDGKFVIVIQGDATDVFRSAIARIVTRYVAAMEDYNPYPESGAHDIDDLLVVT
ncbi:expressed unknown protein [Seminavis robusta]|uniref:Uncharacterized protein n=1 Tax=Seminavis robusta TaxID=568900 RepID=A0A9N8E365_9STRA|nr:expressed unknown protein [Seminavis robusta]|eukprot:Sro609_g175060.1 n/a (451) ;mRNA; f:34502-35854